MKVKVKKKSYGADMIFPIINKRELSVAMEIRLLIESAPKNYAVNSSNRILLHMNFDQEWSTGLWDILWSPHYGSHRQLIQSSRGHNSNMFTSILVKFKLNRDSMSVLITKFDDYQMKNKQIIVRTRSNMGFVCLSSFLASYTNFKKQWSCCQSDNIFTITSL